MVCAANIALMGWPYSFHYKAMECAFILTRYLLQLRVVFYIISMGVTLPECLVKKSIEWQQSRLPVGILRAPKEF